MKYVFLFAALHGLFGSRNKKYIFNRKDGTVTYPARGWFKSITQPFDETIFIMSQVGPFGNKGDDMLAILRPDGWTRSIINAEWVDKFFSLYVWYMDKNRPLPPGTAFDPYRERDYERRKGEGFPEPLYPAELNIVEHEGGRVEIIAAPKKPLGYGDLYFLKLKKEHRREKIIQAKKKQWIAQGLDADEEEQKERERYRKEKSREINEKKRKGELTSTEKYFWNMEEKEQKKKERNQKKEAWIAQGLDPRKEEKKEKKARQEQRERERRKKAGEHIPERKEENNTGPRMLRELKKRK